VIDNVVERVDEPVVLRRQMRVEGVVQGVGFRPHVYRLATTLELSGFVENVDSGVTIEVEGSENVLDELVRRLNSELPPLARIDKVTQESLAPSGTRTFVIHDSESASKITTMLPPDIATCSDCLNEIYCPSDRRFRYPFTNCTNCGPRYSIAESLPYDRQYTTMRGFAMCAECAAEYNNPKDRRFHAQPIACPDCGPQLRLVNGTGAILATRHEGLLAAAEMIRRGRIVALKGLGGYQLLADARNASAVAELRRRKRRPGKPFAVMFPDVVTVKNHLDAADLECPLLDSKEAPIVLIRRKDQPPVDQPIASSVVAPENPYIGAMLPYTPLHHLLMRELGFPIVATSGNVADEPMITEDDEALQRLGAIADAFLAHDRPIAAAIDDSVVRIVANRPLMLRCARGYAPLSILFPHRGEPLIGVGGHLKSAAAIVTPDRVVAGPHIGDLNGVRARTAYEQSLNHLLHLYADTCAGAASDCHPDYFTTRRAQAFGVPVYPVQHHLAHLEACMADNAIDGPVLGVAWDGTGYGDDGTIWGGEFFAITGASVRRVAHFRPFRLPGGDAAVAEPRRAAAGVLYELFQEAMWDAAPSELLDAFSPRDREVVARMLSKKVNAPATSSAGRLFDAVASITGLAQLATFEGQAAMAVEHPASSASNQAEDSIDWRLELTKKGSMSILDWEPLMLNILSSVAQRRPVSAISAAFHHALAKSIVEVADAVGEPRVVLTGGCFQNRYLMEAAITRLRAAGFEPLWHRRLPSNDGNLAVGQAVHAARRMKESAPCA